MRRFFAENFWIPNLEFWSDKRGERKKFSPTPTIYRRTPGGIHRTQFSKSPVKRSTAPMTQRRLWIRFALRALVENPGASDAPAGSLGPTLGHNSFRTHRCRSTALPRDDECG